MNSITKRWVRGSLLFTLLVVLVAEGLFVFYIISGYYSRVRDTIQYQINSTIDRLDLYSGTSAAVQDQQLRGMMEQFDEKTILELMLVDTSGRVVATSSGVLPPENTPPDVAQALAGEDKQGYYVGNNSNGEKVMAITHRVPFVSTDIAAVRLVTSMVLIDRTITNLILLSAVLLLGIVLATVLSGMYFIRSIVIPLGKVEASAARIAQGDLDVRIDNQSNDEIGSLCQTINNMAEELSRSEKMKNDFISSVSHELRTPLTSIKGWAETVGGIDDPDDPNFRRGVSIIAGEADRLYDMVEDLLDFSRMQTGLELQCELLDMAAEVEEAVLLNEQRAASLGVKLCYTPSDLPVPTMADKNRVRQVLVNVLDNAIKYSAPGAAIALQASVEGDEVVVTVQDEGQGIAPEDLENVRVRFYKGKGSARGSGIGLAVADEIMQAHGGSMALASELGKGTLVTLIFPLYNGTRASGRITYSTAPDAPEAGAESAPAQNAPQAPEA